MATTASTVLRVPLPELYDLDSGRLDAKKVAEYLSVSLTQIAAALGRNYHALYKTPASAGIQNGLLPIKHVLDMLVQVLGDRPLALAWLNSPHQDLELQRPLDLILAGRADAVEGMLMNALEGIPS